MKKFALAAIAALGIFIGGAAQAADAPKVILDNRTIEFEDAQPVITDAGRTLVPLRGIFERMGAKVKWYESTREVLVEGSDNVTKLVLTIDSEIMKHRTMTGLLDYDEKLITLDTKPVIMQDRTMVPLRVISESFGCDVAWDGDTRTITINTKKNEKTPVSDSGEKAPAQTADEHISVSLSADKVDVSKGDTVKVYINLDNIEDKNLANVGSSVRVMFDSTKLKFIDFQISDEIGDKYMGGSNDKYNDNSVKVIYVTMMDKNVMFKNGAFMTLIFEALEDEGGELWLSDAVSTNFGGDVSLVTNDENGQPVSIEDDDELKIDTTHLVIK